MDKESLKIKIFLNFCGTYKEVHHVGLLHTTLLPRGFCFSDLMPAFVAAVLS